MTRELDEVIHAPTRLQICSFLASVDEAEFGVVRDALQISDSVLSKHARILHEAGYLTSRKPTGLGRVRTWLALTPSGLTAYGEYLGTLRSLLSF